MSLSGSRDPSFVFFCLSAAGPKRPRDRPSVKRGPAAEMLRNERVHNPLLGVVPGAQANDSPARFRIPATRALGA